MSDAGEGLVDAEARLQEQMDAREHEKRRRTAGKVADPEKHRANENLRLARADLATQLELTANPARRTRSAPRSRKSTAAWPATSASTVRARRAVPRGSPRFVGRGFHHLGPERRDAPCSWRLSRPRLHRHRRRLGIPRAARHARRRLSSGAAVAGARHVRRRHRRRRSRGSSTSRVTRPLIDGARLDDIVDYVTFVLVPAVIVWRALLVPPAWVLPVVRRDAAVERAAASRGATPRPPTTSSPAFRRTGTSSRSTCWRPALSPMRQRVHPAGAGDAGVRADPLRLSVAHRAADEDDGRVVRVLGRADDRDDRTLPTAAASPRLERVRLPDLLRRRSRSG